MNWRHVGVNDSAKSIKYCRSQLHNDSGCRDHFYDHPNTDLIPGLASPGNEWFDYLKEQKLRTYFNDHPFPIATQTTPKEVNFRYKGLSEWIGRGLSYFWYDHNWGFTLPGPRMPYSTTDPYEGLSGQVWGSHVYFEATAAAYKEHGIADRPIALTRDNGPNWKAKDPMGQALAGAGSPAHHRYPVWWTGDGVSLYASVVSMVLEAVHDFRAYVHSDCGGHGDRSSCPATMTGAPPEDKACSTPNDAALLRWTAHCVMGTIVRYVRCSDSWCHAVLSYCVILCPCFSWKCASVGDCRSGGCGGCGGCGGDGGGGGKKRQDRLHPIDAAQDNHDAVLACELLQTLCTL